MGSGVDRIILKDDYTFMYHFVALSQKESKRVKALVNDLVDHFEERIDTEGDPVFSDNGEVTNWESVHSFFYKSSYEQLNLMGEVYCNH